MKFFVFYLASSALFWVLINRMGLLDGFITTAAIEAFFTLILHELNPTSWALW